MANRKFVLRCWAIAQPYWVSQEKFGAGSLLILSWATIFAFSALNVALNRQSGNMISALAAQSSSKLVPAVLTFLGVLLVYIPVAAAKEYLPKQLALYWRRWMSRRFLGKYFSDRSYYQIGGNSQIDNPDQRIAQDIDTFTTESLTVLTVVLDTISGLMATSVAIWLISKELLIVVLIYGILGNLIGFGVFGRILTRLNFVKFQKEADFRFGLIRIRENAESIAFYQGEERETQEIKNRLNTIVKNDLRIMNWQQLYLRTFDNIFQRLPTVLNIIVLAPRVLSGNLEVGAFVEGRSNMMRLQQSLSLGLRKLGNISKFAAAVERLEALETMLEKQELAPEDRRTIDFRKTEALAVSHLTLQTPNYQQTLFRDLSVELPPRGSLLVVGDSGCGKSSLLRAIAGLWTSGTGNISRPNLSEMLFLPQRPYMILGSLRDQLLYPHTIRDVTDSELHQVLQAVNLANLPERVGGFDRSTDFASLLSLGEQQRLAFARLLLSQPDYAILDEATSALDVENEELLYQSLQATGTTFLSVGHRPSLVKYHQQVLQITPDRGWQVMPAASYGMEDFSPHYKGR